MKQRKIYITEKDKQKLERLFASTIGFRSRDLKNVKDLLNELERAEIIDGDLKKNIITMNSKVVVEDLKTKKSHTYTIVYPEAANSEENKISILAPVATALLGYGVGDTVEWEVPAGKRKLRVKKISYQPKEVEKAA